VPRQPDARRDAANLVKRLDTEARRLYCEGQAMDLTSKEFAVIELLMLRAGRVVTKQQILDNLWDEEHGKENHAELWLRFAEGVGVSREDVASATPNEATKALVDMYFDVTGDASVAEGVAALYAYERQVPQVAGSKIDGLAKHYGIDDKRSTKFFAVHGVMDIEHSGAEREMLGELAADADPAPIEAATARALEAWWNFLSAVDLPAPVAA